MNALVDAQPLRFRLPHRLPHKLPEMDIGTLHGIASGDKKNQYVGLF